MLKVQVQEIGLSAADFLCSTLLMVGELIGDFGRGFEDSLYPDLHS